MRRARLRVKIALTITLIGAYGCSSILAPRPDPTHFFILSASNSTPAPHAIQKSVGALTIGLGPVGFPDYLARAEIVSRTADNRVELAANDRWAEPLDVTFKRVLALDLARALDDAQVAAFPWFGSKPEFTYRIEVTVDRFETDAQNVAHLAARWSVISSADNRVQYASASALDVPAASADHAAMATALSAAEDQFAVELAAAVRRLRGSKAG
jgi:uncharacterized lipoprotein YmbA